MFTAVRYWMYLTYKNMQYKVHWNPGCTKKPTCQLKCVNTFVQVILRKSRQQLKSLNSLYNCQYLLWRTSIWVWWIIILNWITLGKHCFSLWSTSPDTRQWLNWWGQFHLSQISFKLLRIRVSSWDALHFWLDMPRYTNEWTNNYSFQLLSLRQYNCFKCCCAGS